MQATHRANRTAVLHALRALHHCTASHCSVAVTKAALFLQRGRHHNADGMECRKLKLGTEIFDAWHCIAPQTFRALPAEKERANAVSRAVFACTCGSVGSSD